MPLDPAVGITADHAEPVADDQECLMGCLLVLFAMISPRFAVFMLYLFDNDRMTRAFTSGWIALIGFFFLPWTTLAWAVCFAWPAGVSGFGYLVVGFAFFVDLASYGSGARERQRRAQYA